LLELLSLEALRFAGPRASYPNLEFELPDLSGVAELRSLRVLSITDMPIRSLRPLATLTALEDLFVQDNEIESLEGIETLTGLRALYCQGNRIESLAPIESLTKLKTLYASRNRLQRIDGLHAGHVPSLEQFFILPNDGLDPAELTRVQTRLGIQCRRG
jgi:Leucine-rich repeat (LRR) protein